MSVSNSQAQGLVLALFGASAGGHLTSLAAASNLNILAGDLTMSAGLILGKDLSSNTAFRDHITANLKLTGDALTAANAWLDGQLNAGAARGDMVATAVTFLATLTDTTSPFYAAAQTFNTTVASAVTWSTGAGATTFGVSALRANQGNVDVVAGSSFVLTTSTDTIIGTAGNDTITGDKTTYESSNADQVVDASLTDNDTYNLTYDGATTVKSTSIENVNLNLNSLGAAQVTASSMSGVKVLTVTRGDVVVGGSTLVGDKSVDVTSLDASKIGKLVAGAATKTVTVTQATKAGVVIDAKTASGNITVTGSATVDAANSTGVVVAGGISGNTTENAKAFTLDAAKVTSVNIGSNTDGGTTVDNTAITGKITVNAAKAAIVKAAVSGGAEINVLGGTTGVALTAIDDSGATVSTSYAGTSTAKGVVDLTGTSASTDVATVSAAGTTTLNNSNVDTLNLSGNGAAVTYELNAAATRITKTGTQTVTLSGAAATFTGNTVNGVDVLKITTGSNALDGSKFTNVGKIEVGANIGANAITVVEGQTVEFTSDTQTALDINYKTGATNVNLIVGDVNGTTTTTGTLSAGAFDAAAGSTDVGTVNLTANASHFSATSTVIGAKQNLSLTGNKNFTLGAVTANQVDASSVTGIVTATSNGNVKAISTGSGADDLTVNSDTVHIISAGAGNDTITITDAAATSQFSGGEGNDSFTMTEIATAYVAVGDAGDDVFTAGDDFDAVIVGGDGSDTLVLTADSDFTSRTNFAWSAVEKLDLTTASVGVDVIMTAAQFASDNAFEVSGAADNDTFRVNAASTGSTINASAVTVKSGSVVTLTYAGAAGADTITGGVAAETFLQSAGSDTIEGGATGTDAITLIAASTDVDGSAGSVTNAGVVLNLGSTAVAASTVAAATGRLLHANVTSVAAGTSTWLFTAADSTFETNQSISGIENVTGGSGVDYIVGSDAANSIVVSDATAADYVIAGDGNDTVTANVDDTVDGGLGTDTLRLSGTVTTSTTESQNEIDLASTSDQLVSINNATNTQVQKGFENVDLSGLTVTSTGGFTIKAAAAGSTIVATADTDVINSGAGADDITGGSGVDTYVFAGTGGSTETAMDVLRGVANTETLNFAAVTAVGGGAITVARVAPKTGATTADVTSATITNGVITGFVTGDGTTNATAATTAHDTFSEVLAAVRVSVASAGELAVFSFGSDEYVFIENGAADVIVRLVGVDVTAVAVASEIATVTI